MHIDYFYMATDRVKWTSPSFSASKTWRETITEHLFYNVAKIGKSGQTEKTVDLSPFSIFFYFFGGPRSLGLKTLNVSFSRAFERSVWHFPTRF